MAFNQLRSSALKINSILANRTYFTYSKCISQPLERDAPYVEAREAVKCIKSGNYSNCFKVINFMGSIWSTYLLRLWHHLNFENRIKLPINKPLRTIKNLPQVHKSRLRDPFYKRNKTCFVT